MKYIILLSPSIILIFLRYLVLSFMVTVQIKCILSVGECICDLVQWDKGLAVFLQIPLFSCLTSYEVTSNLLLIEEHWRQHCWNQGLQSVNVWLMQPNPHDLELPFYLVLSRQQPYQGLVMKFYLLHFCVYSTKKSNRISMRHLDHFPFRLVSWYQAWPKSLPSHPVVAVFLDVQWLSATRRRGKLSCPVCVRAWWCPKMLKKKLLSEVLEHLLSTTPMPVLEEAWGHHHQPVLGEQLSWILKLSGISSNMNLDSVKRKRKKNKHKTNKFSLYVWVGT